MGSSAVPESFAAWTALTVGAMSAANLEKAVLI